MLSLSSRSLDFRNVKVGKNKTLSFTFKNTAKTKLAGEVDAGGIVPPFNVSAGAGSFSLARNKTQKVSVTFAPMKAGSFMQTITIRSGDPKHPTTTVTVKGKGR
jgi:hypothetical protein